MGLVGDTTAPIFPRYSKTIATADCALLQCPSPSAANNWSSARDLGETLAAISLIRAGLRG
eukprot:10287242-Alexandrium_andersonii.AAC.1